MLFSLLLGSFYMQWAGGATFMLCSALWLYYELSLRLLLPRARRMRAWVHKRLQTRGAAAPLIEHGGVGGALTAGRRASLTRLPHASPSRVSLTHGFQVPADAAAVPTARPRWAAATQGCIGGRNKRRRRER